MDRFEALVFQLGFRYGDISISPTEMKREFCLNILRRRALKKILPLELILSRTF
jgi:hypothetical protein